MLLALARKLQRGIDAGEIDSMAAVGTALGVTRSRVSQILDLALLPIAVKEDVLFAESVDGREVVTERWLRGKGGSGVARGDGVLTGRGPGGRLRELRDHSRMIRDFREGGAWEPRGAAQQPTSTRFRGTLVCARVDSTSQTGARLPFGSLPSNAPVGTQRDLLWQIRHAATFLFSSDGCTQP